MHCRNKACKHNRSIIKTENSWSQGYHSFFSGAVVGVYEVTPRLNHSTVDTASKTSDLTVDDNSNLYRVVIGVHYKNNASKQWIFKTPNSFDSIISNIRLCHQRLKIGCLLAYFIMNVNYNLHSQVFVKPFTGFCKNPLKQSDFIFIYVG